MAKLLLIDDDPQIRRLIKTFAENEGHICTEAENGAIGLQKFKESDFDIVILDVMMPVMDGWDTLSKIREISNIPVILLTARGEEYDRLFGFGLGADDFVPKPFSSLELLARVKALLKRSKIHEKESTELTFGSLSINEISRTVKIDSEKISLTPKEYDLLLYLSKHPNQVFSREQLLNNVWGYDFFGDARTVDTHIKSLRDRIKKYRGCIVTVWGVGYRFEFKEASK